MLRYPSLRPVWLALCALVLALPMPTLAAHEGAPDQQLPKWEIGVAGGTGWQYHYPGADQGGGAIGAAPYFIYRTKHFRIGEGGLVSGRLLETDQIAVTASIGGSLPANSANNRAREGMPDLDALIEIGPQVVFSIARNPDIDSWSLSLPLRAVLSTDLGNLKYRGLLFQPRLGYSREHLGIEKLSGSVSAGPIFAADKLMDFFYDVDPIYATPDRPTYEAQGGYMGSDLTVGLTYRITKRFKVYLGGEVTTLAGATNADSPLLRQNTNYSIGAGFTWRIFASKKMVQE